MAVILLLVFIAVPIAEIAVFIEVGGRIGPWPTIGIVVVTAMVGTTLLRHQGLATLARVQESLARNLFPVAEVFDGLCLLVAGALLLTPGFVTDTAGLLLFVPPLRRSLGAVLGRYLLATGRVTGWGTAGGGGGPAGGTVIDGEYHEVPPGNGATGDGDNGAAPPSGRILPR